jgi:cupin superfamily acireductone dioxygenase involved in methionine salvage
MKLTTTILLADLACAVADYETAWRNHDANAMREHYNARDNAREALVHEQGLLPRDVLNIEAALVIAAARPEGERVRQFREEHTRYGGGEQYAADFIHNYSG